jgi:tRNA(Ile)-lysidine synthase
MVSQFLQRLASLGMRPGERAVVAVSGGGDSVALLDLLAGTAEFHRLELLVAHVDHGIHPDSGMVAERVEQLARSHHLRCITTHLGLGPSATETEAREARYAWLDEVREREGAEYIITAHHADDQVETVLLRLLHGSGPAGLAAMAARRGPLVRPLLAFSRQEIAGYLGERRLSFWDDPANRDPRHLRSWIRSDLLPVIRQRVPGVDQALLQVASQAGEDRSAWDQVLQLLPGLNWREEETGCSVAAAVLGGYDSTLGVAILRALGRRAGCRINRDQAERAIRLIRENESGSRLEIGNGWEVEIVFDRAQLFRSVEDTAGRAATAPLVLDGEAGDGELGRWRLYWRREAAPPAQRRDDLTAWFTPEALAIRRWEPGDRIHPLGGPGRRLVVKCLQEARVPRRLREGWPMVLDRAGEVVWVPGVCRSNRLVPLGGAEALRVDAQVI